MSAHTFYLKPVDTFFFKGQQISEAGNDNNMFGIFPPRPNTVYGALRSAYIHEHIPFYEKSLLHLVDIKMSGQNLEDCLAHYPHMLEGDKRHYRGSRN